MSEILWNGKSLNLSALVIPAFFIFTGLEFIAARRQKKQDLFSFNNSMASISIGIAERLLSLLLTASFYNVFLYIYNYHALWNIPNHWAVWAALIMTTDLIWYWYHRLGHEINILWAAHIVHHQSEEFNFTVAARITVFQALVRNSFWCMLPFAGFHPDMVMATLLVHGTYSFFTHTQMIPKLGWLEYILITPSHHRVHHASNEKYLNRNYGDLFIFWDKLFGTFQREEEKPVYGLTHPLKSYSFMWQHFHYFMELAHAVAITPGFLAKIGIIFGNPEALDQGIREKLERVYLPNQVRSAKKVKSHNTYLIIQITVSTLIVFLVTLFYSWLSPIEVIAICLFVLLTLINCGALLEQRSWIFYLEYIRILLPTGYLSFYFHSPGLGLGIAILVALVFWPLQKWYFRTVYKMS